MLAGLTFVLPGRAHVGKEANKWVMMSLGQRQLKRTPIRKIAGLVREILLRNLG